jgi:hypothetical protein
MAAVRNSTPRQPPVAASFCRIRARSGMVGPGQRQTGNNWLSAPVTSGNRKPAPQASSEGRAGNIPVPCSRPAISAANNPTSAAHSDAATPSCIIAGKPKRLTHCPARPRTRSSSKPAPGAPSGQAVAAPSAISNGAAAASHQRRRNQPAASGSGWPSAVGNRTGKVPNAASPTRPRELM